jgi:beta-lactamase regulating signal transducer with metallopeptidase domain
MNPTPFEILRLSPFEDQTTLFLIDIALKATAILLATVALNLGLRRASAATRHLLWSLSLMGLLALPALTYALPSWRVSILPESFSISKTAEPAGRVATVHTFKAEREAKTARPSVDAKLAFEDQAAASREQALKDDEPAATPSNEGLGWGQWVLIIWLAGIIISLGRFLVGIVAVWSLSRRADEITDPAWNDLSRDISRQLGLPRRVSLLKSPGIAMPQTWGTLRPAILLPVDADDWPRERRHVVLMHELAHVKRKDCLTQAMAQVACALYWFNPLVWIAARRLRMERELACDDHVLGTGTRASDYADLLLETARSLRSGSCSSLTAVAMARQSQLEGRLLAILDPSLNRKGLNRIGSSLVVLSLALIILPLASLRPTAQVKASSVDAESIELIGSQPEHNNPRSETQIVTRSKQASEQEAEKRLQQSEQEPQAEQDVEQEQAEQAEAEPQQEEKSTEQPGGAIRALIDALKDGDEQVRKQAAWALGMKGGRTAEEMLVAALKDADAEVRAEAAWALGMQGSERSVEPLISALKDEFFRVRSQAAWALGMRGDKRAVDALIAALKDEKANVRSQAAWSLGMLGSQRAIEPLNAAMKDEHPHVRQNAAWALGMLLINSRPMKINVTLDTKTKIDVDAGTQEVVVEPGDIDVDVNPNPNPDEDRDAKPRPVRPRRRARSSCDL